MASKDKIDKRMFVPGKKDGGGTENAPTKDTKLYCEPCESKGKRHPAHGYCKTCANYLCQECFRYHTLPVPMQHHVLLDKDSMPTTPTPKQRQAIACTITCRYHPTKTIEFYCPSHNAVACSVCSVLNHKQCHVEYIPDYAEGIQKTPEYQKFKSQLSLYNENVTTYKTEAVAEIRRAIESNDGALECVRTLKADMIADLDTKERTLMDHGDKLRAEEDKLAESVDTGCQAMTAEVDEIQRQLAAHNANDGDIFVAVKLSEELLEKVRTLSEKSFKSLKAVTYKFEPDQRYTTLLSPTVPLGEITKNTTLSAVTPLETPTYDRHPKIDFKTVQITELPGVNVRSSSDKNSCCITGMTYLPPATLLVADYYDTKGQIGNNYVKAINVTTNKITSSLQLPSQPADLALLPQAQVAVTMPFEQQIRVISTTGGLAHVRQFKVNGCCVGLDSTEDKLVVGYVKPGKVQVLDHHGGVLHTITTDHWDQPIFQYPHYVAVSHVKDQEVIHVSDGHAKSIISMTMEGTILHTYTDANLNIPAGISVTADGQQLVSNLIDNKRYNMHVVSQDGKKVSTLPRDRYLSGYIQSIYYCHEKNTLYCGLVNSDMVQVFKF